MSRPLWGALLLGLASASAMAQIAVPLVPGLTLTTAIAEPDGDYESRKRLLAREEDGWRLAYSADVRDAQGQLETIQSERIVHDADLASARAYRNYFESDVEEDYPGTTALGVSSVVLEELKGPAVSRFVLVGDDSFLRRAFADGPVQDQSVLAMASAFTASAGTSFKGELKRQGSGTLEVLVNGRLQELQVVVAAGLFTAKSGRRMQAELHILDDAANPIALEWRIGETRLRVVRIDYPMPVNDLANTLKAEKRVALPGLYFDFGSAVLRPESAAALPAILEAVRAAPEGLMLEGHTDNVGNTKANQALSLARAESVWSALSALDPSLGPKPVIQGFGATRPRASNDTLEGRAQNRRVELAVP